MECQIVPTARKESLKGKKGKSTKNKEDDPTCVCAEEDNQIYTLLPAIKPPKSTIEVKKSEAGVKVRNVNTKSKDENNCNNNTNNNQYNHFTMARKTSPLLSNILATDDMEKQVLSAKHGNNKINQINGGHRAKSGVRVSLDVGDARLIAASHVTGGSQAVKAKSQPASPRREPEAKGRGRERRKSSTTRSTCDMLQVTDSLAISCFSDILC